MDPIFARTQAIYWVAAVAFCLFFAVIIGFLLFDKRQIATESVWAKPLKFSLALAIHFATLALATSALSPEYRASSTLWTVSIAAVSSAVFEFTYIAVQAARSQTSHFNLSTPFYATMYSLMAAGAIVITAAAGAVGVAVWSDDASAFGAVLRHAVTLGLIGGTILTLIVAFRMGSMLIPVHRFLEARFEEPSPSAVAGSRGPGIQASSPSVLEAICADALRVVALKHQ